MGQQTSSSTGKKSLTEGQIRHEALLAQLKELDKKISEAPPDAETLYKRGDVKIRLNMLEEAITDFDEAISRFDSNNGEIYFSRGYAKHLLLHFEQAIADFDQALLCKLDSEFFFMRAICKKNLLLYEEALMDLDAALEQSKEPEFLITRAHVRRKLGMLKEALSDAESASLLTNDPVAINFMGSLRLDLGEYHEANACFDKALKLTDEEYVDALDNRGLCKFKLGKHADALQDFRNAVFIVKHGNERPLSRALLILPLMHGAFAMREMGWVEPSIKALTEALDIIKEYELNSGTRLAPMVVDKATHNFNEARISDLELNFLKGVCLYGLGKYSEALDNVNTVIAREDKVFRHFALRGNILRAQKMYSKAQQDYATAIRLNPWNIEAKVEMAVNKLEAGDAENSLAEFDRIMIERNSESYVHLHYCKGCTLEIMGRFADADVEFARVCQISPNHFCAMRARVRIEEHCSPTASSLLIVKSKGSHKMNS